MLKKCFSNKKFVVGFIILVPLIIVMIFGNFLVPNDPYALDTVNMLKNSSAKYPLGTDEYGRCILTRLILGIRPSMMVALGGTAISFAGGTLLGVAAGYLEGRIGAVIMRGIDIILCFPPILLAMIIAGLWGAGVINLMLVIGLLYIPHFHVSHILPHCKSEKWNMWRAIYRLARRRRLLCGRLFSRTSYRF